MQRLRSFSPWCVAAVFLLWAASASAADLIIGTAIGVRGVVLRESGGERQALKPHDAVHLGDTIVAEDGKAEILLNDGSIVSVGAKSRLVLSQYKSVSNALTTRFHLFEGVLRLFVNRATAGGEFEIETETAVAAVRGTDWLMEVVPGRTGVAILHGIIAVSGVGAQRNAVVVLQKPGDGVDVKIGEAPGPIHPWSRERLAAVLARASFN